MESIAKQQRNFKKTKGEATNIEIKRSVQVKQRQNIIDDISFKTELFFQYAKCLTTQNRQQMSCLTKRNDKEALHKRRILR